MTPFTLSVFSIGADKTGAAKPPPEPEKDGGHPAFDDLLSQRLDADDTAVSKARASARADAESKAKIKTESRQVPSEKGTAAGAAESSSEKEQPAKGVKRTAAEEKKAAAKVKKAAVEEKKARSREGDTDGEEPVASVAQPQQSATPTAPVPMVPAGTAQTGVVMAGSEEMSGSGTGGDGGAPVLPGPGMNPSFKPEAGPFPGVEGAKEAATTKAGKAESDPFNMAMRQTAARSGKTSAANAPRNGAPLNTRAATFGEELMERVGRMRVIARAGQPEQVRIQLEPRELGSLDMRLQVDDESRVHLLITAESEAAKDMLNRQMSQLREALARQNLMFGEVTVQVDDEHPWQQGAHWRSGGDGGAGRRAFSRGEEKSPAGQGKPLPAIPADDGRLNIVV